MHLREAARFGLDARNHVLVELCRVSHRNGLHLLVGAVRDDGQQDVVRCADPVHAVLENVRVAARRSHDAVHDEYRDVGEVVREQHAQHGLALAHQQRLW